MRNYKSMMQASVPAVIAQIGPNSVDAYIIRGYDASDISRLSMTGPAAPIMNVSLSKVVTSSGDQYVARWRRPLIASVGSGDLNIEPSTPFGMVVAAGPSSTLQKHTVWDFVPDVTLARQCSESTNCPLSYGRCEDTRGFGSCICKLGRTGADCSQCAEGFSGPTCEQMSPSLQNATASGIVSFSAPASSLSPANIRSEVAEILGISSDRLSISLSPGASPSRTLVTLNIAAPTVAGEISAPQAMNLLQAALSNSRNPIYLSPAFSTVDRYGSMSVSFAAPGPGIVRVYTHEAVLSKQLTIRWSVEELANVGPVAYFAVEYTGDPRWFGIGFNSVPMMVGADAIAFEPLSGTKVRQLVLTAKKGSMRGVDPSTLIPSESEVYTANGRYIGTFARPLAAGSYDGARALETSWNTIIWAHGERGQITLGKHEGEDAGMGNLNLKTGSYSPIRPSIIKVHAILMFLCWAILAPAGIFAARFFKHAQPSTGPASRWFVVHKYVQSGTSVLLIIGFATGVAISGTGTHFKEPHSIIGITVFLLGILQPLIALARPAKMPPSKKRTSWEWVHKIGGYGSVLLAAANICIGLWVLRSIVLIVLYAVFVAICVAVFCGFQAGLLQKYIPVGSPDTAAPMQGNASPIATERNKQLTKVMTTSPEYSGVALAPLPPSNRSIPSWSKDSR
jgi:hypothetical protein